MCVFLGLQVSSHEFQSRRGGAGGERKDLKWSKVETWEKRGIAMRGLQIS